jgi:hypothetical protein
MMHAASAHVRNPRGADRAVRLFGPVPMMNSFPLLVLCCCAAPLWAAAQDPKPPVAAPVIAADGYTEGFGRATNYRTALAQALEDAVGKAKGIAVARGPGVRSRLSVVSGWSDDVPNGWFDGESDQEREWVQQQIQGFVQRYEVSKKDKANDGQWEVTVRAMVAMHDGREPVLVIALAGNELGKWQLERSEEGAQGGAFARDGGDYRGPHLRENLLRSGAVKVLAGSGGVKVADGSAPGEREKQGRQLVASHRVIVNWEPMQLQSVVEKPNKARPTAGPRPEWLVAGLVQVQVKVVDLVQDIEVFERPITIALDVPPGTGLDRRDAFVVKLADQANAAVAEQVFFALRPPVVLRKWPGEGGADWFVEVRMSRRVATGYDAFALGNPGSLASPDWQRLGTAALVGGTDDSCTFRLLEADAQSRIEAEFTEVRPVRK